MTADVLGLDAGPSPRRPVSTSLIVTLPIVTAAVSAVRHLEVLL